MNEVNSTEFLKDLVRITHKHYGVNKPQQFKFGELLTADKTAIMTYDGKTPAVSKKVRYIVEGKSYDVHDGIHEMKDGSRIETKDSYITAIIPAEKMPTAKEQPAQTFTKQPKAWTREQTVHFMRTGQTPNQIEFAQRNAEWRKRYGL